MYKNQLQELAQRSCFNLPSYACIREGPDHAPRFRASVNFNGEVFEGPSYCTTLRQAEHAAAEVALSNLSTRGPSRSLAARVLDETGVYKNLLQETAHRAGLRLPVYTTVRSGPGHSPVFTCAVELAGMNFAGEPAKTKKQAEKNAAMAAWAALRQMPNLGSLSVQIKESESSEEQEQVVVARVLSNFRPKEENKPMWQRDQQLQQRRRVMLGYKEGAAGSSHNSLRYRHQWRSSGPLPDASSVYPAQQQQRQSSLLALPPKILLAPLPLFHHSYATQEPSSSMDNNNNNHPSLISSSKPIPVQMKNRSQVIIQEIPTPMDEHQRDDKEWMDERSAVKGKDIEKDSYNAKPAPASGPVSAPRVASHLHSSSGLATRTQDSKTHQIQFSSRAFSPPPPMDSAPMRNLPAFPILRVINSGGFHAPGIAPAVHVRSVIPVCAAPPMRPPPSTAASSMREPEEELSAANSKLNKLQL